MEAYLRTERARSDIVGSTERRDEVVKRVLVGYVDGRKSQADFVFVAAEQIVVSDGDVKEMPRCNAGRVVIGVVGSRRRDRHQRRSVLRSRAETVRANGRAERICCARRRRMN